MGTKFGPIMSNLFMAKWEEDIIDTPRDQNWFCGEGTLMTSHSYGIVIENLLTVSCVILIVMTVGLLFTMK